jgi:hypothetical protein
MRIRKPSAALIVALTALFIALGGGAYRRDAAREQRWHGAAEEPLRHHDQGLLAD